MFNRDSIGTYKANNELYQVHNTPLQGKKQASHLATAKDSLEQMRLDKQILFRKISMPALFGVPKEKVVEVGRAGQTIFYALASVPFFVLVKAPVVTFQAILPLFVQAGQLTMKALYYFAQKTQEMLQAVVLQPLQLLAKQFRKISRKVASLFEKLQGRLGKGFHFFERAFSRFSKKCKSYLSSAMVTPNFWGWLFSLIQKVKALFTSFYRWVKKGGALFSFLGKALVFLRQTLFGGFVLFLKKTSNFCIKLLAYRPSFLQKSTALSFAFVIESFRKAFLKTKALSAFFASNLESCAKKLSKSVSFFYAPLITWRKSFFKAAGKSASSAYLFVSRFSLRQLLNLRGFFHKNFAPFFEKWKVLSVVFQYLSFFSVFKKPLEKVFKRASKILFPFFPAVIALIGRVFHGLVKSSAARMVLAFSRIFFLCLLVPFGVVFAIVHYSTKYVFIGLSGAFKQLRQELFSR